MPSKLWEKSFKKSQKKNKFAATKITKTNDVEVIEIKSRQSLADGSKKKATFFHT